MLSVIIRFSVRNKLIIGICTLALIVWGVFATTQLPIDAVPDITNNQVQVITVSPSLAAPEVERLITFPVEQTMATIPGIIEMRSFSRFGLSLVTIVFNDATNVYWARQQVTERLQQVRAQIPADAGNPELAPVTTGLGEIFQYVVKPKKGFETNYSLAELRTIQDWMVRRQLLGTPGVADVSSFGGALKQYEVAVNTQKLQSLGVNMTDVFTALQKNNQNTGGAYIEKGPQVLFIRTEGLAKNNDDINNVVVKNTNNGMPVLIRDVGVVKTGRANRYGAMTFNDAGEVTGAVVMMLKGENSSKVIKAVKERIKEIEKNLPEGVMIEPFLDRTKMVNNAISTVETNLLEGALIVLLVLVLFLGNIRAGLLVSSVIPLSMLFAIIMMNLFGVSGNLMSLGALDFGLIVDGAVIIVEAVMFYLYHSNKVLFNGSSYTQQQMDETVENTAGKMMGAAVFGQIIILIVYLPILSLVGIEGKMFKPMAQTVSFALIGAFVLSLTYVPMMTALVMSKKLKQSHNLSDRFMVRLQSWYKPVLLKALAYPKTVIAITLLLFASAIFIINTLGGEFIPELEEGDFAVDTRVLTGSSLTTTIEATQKTAKLLLQNFPEVEKVVTKIGSGEIPTDPMPIEAADMMVILKDKKEWTSAKSFDELANKMSMVLQQVPGVSTGFQFPVQMRFNELMTGARQDVVCKIFGEDLDTLAYYAQQLGSLMGTVKGAKDVYVETVTGIPQVVINYNRQAIALFKLNIEDVNRIVRTAFAGESAGMIYENERRFDLVVRLEETQRKDITNIQQLLVPTPGGVQVPLYQLADVSIKEGPNQIQREDAKRRIAVGFNVRGSDVQTAVKNLQQKVKQQLKLPAGYYIKYGGQFQNLEEAQARLSIAVPVALLLILLLLYFAFGSVKYGLLIFSAIPLSAIGGIYALWLRQLPFSISAGVGFIALFGVAVLNGIVLIAAFNRLKQDAQYNSIQQIITEGTASRLRPVLMTAAVASLGFLPMALSKGAGAEVQRPLATVVIGGLITATLLTLLVLPVLYAWFERPAKNTNMKPVTVILLLAAVLPFKSFSQQTQSLTLEKMLALAKQQNLLVQQQIQQQTYWKQLQQQVYELPKTQFTTEYGNINSFNTDTRFNLMQSFTMPVIYKRQAALYAANQQLAAVMQQLTEKEISKQVRIAFYTLTDLMERDKLLTQLEVIYGNVSEAAALRLKAGETNVLEKNSASLQLQQVQLQKKQLAADIKTQQYILQYLLHTSTAVTASYTNIKAVIPAADTAMLAQHPAVLLLQQEKSLARVSNELEKNSRQPEIMVGYSNQSINGWQSADGVTQQLYKSSNRFHTVSAGIALPLVNGASRNRFKAGKIAETITGIKITNSEAALKTEYQQWQQQVQTSVAAINYFENTGLPQASVITTTAKLNFEKGAIDYLQWSQLMSQVITIRSNYLDAVKLHNMAIISLYYLTNNN
ncbi:MAG: CusA/CzcA family heavy metal efflux RND transporter [Flavihumibacter sp.]|nr:CusA/CzcA family heavy metal efflux RND transporter [Flavihumibacter sp.]